MGHFDFATFNGFARQSLDNLVFSDLWSHDVFNESDMHGSAYYYIRDYFRKHDRESVYVRCEPRLAGTEPDIVVYERGNPIYALEFKLFPDCDVVDQNVVYRDLDKLADVLERVPSLKWGFFHMIHDCDDTFRLTDGMLRRRGYERISVTSINARRVERSDRRRVGYDDWRRDFDRLRRKHKEYA